MNIPSQIANHFREVYFGGNWTAVSVKDNLADVTWQEATKQVYGLNTIAILVYHISYYVSAALKVLQDHPLDAKDENSFTHPPILNQFDWQQLLDKTFADAETFAGLVEQLPEQRLLENFTDKKHGNYYRNITGIIEHTHYHLGQIVLLKKILKQVN